MMHILYRLIVLSLLGLICECEPEYPHECVVWNNVTRLLQREQNVEVQCTVNTQCTGIDCVGKYHYQGYLSSLKKFEENMCFGFVIRPCNKPPDLQFYLELLNQSQTLQKNVESSQTFFIPGSHMNLVASMVADGYIQVDMNRTSLKGKQYMNLGLRLKVKVSESRSGLSTYPKDLQVTFVPDMFIPIPGCDASVKTPPHTAHSCMPGKVQTLPPWQPHPTPAQYLPGTKCVPGSATKGCKHQEQCVKGMCECVGGASYNRSTKKCEMTAYAGSTTPMWFIVVDPIPAVASSKMTIIIACCSVLAVLIVAAILTFVIIRYRKHRQIYGGHELLLNNEDDAVEVDT